MDDAWCHLLSYGNESNFQKAEQLVAFSKCILGLIG